MKQVRVLVICLVLLSVVSGVTCQGCPPGKGYKDTNMMNTFLPGSERFCSRCRRNTYQPGGKPRCMVCNGIVNSRRTTCNEDKNLDLREHKNNVRNNRLNVNKVKVLAKKNRKIGNNENE